jgi:hypothetical protein
MGLALIGAASDPEDALLWDCWKPVLHDQSLEPSNGKLLSDLVQDSRVNQVTKVKKDEQNNWC